MVVELAYQIIKDVIALAKMSEAEPIDPGTLDLSKLQEWGLIDEHSSDKFHWVAPQNLFRKAEAPDAPNEIVWVTDQLKREKRKIVRYRHDGGLDLVLVRKKGK